MSVDVPSQQIDGDGNIQIGRDQHVHYEVVIPRASIPPPILVVKVIRKLDEVADGFARRQYGKPSEVEEKLHYNQVSVFAEFIREYGTYGHAVEGAFSALNNAEPQISARVIRFIRALYYDYATAAPPLSSDDILRSLIQELKRRVGQVPDVPAEQVEPCCNMLVAFAFVNCDILKRVPE